MTTQLLVNMWQTLPTPATTSSLTLDYAHDWRCLFTSNRQSGHLRFLLRDTIQRETKERRHKGRKPMPLIYSDFV